MMSSALFRRSFSCYCGAVRMVRTRPLRQLTKSKGSWTFKSKVSLSVMAPIALSRRLLAEEVHVSSAPVIEFTQARSGPGTSLVQCVRLLLADVYSAFRTFLRACQLAVMCSPLFVLTPVALWWPDRYHSTWCDLLVWTLERCGPVSTKVGQWASTRRDLFPALVCQRLSRLQRRTRPHAWGDTERALVSLLGEDYSGRFVSFDRTPIGSGCCAQVYRAAISRRGTNGLKDVAVKVLHPQIEDRFRRDLTVLNAFASAALWLFPSLQWISPEESVREFERMMSCQVDLRVEAANLRRFHVNFKENKGISFPEPIEELSGKEVLVESYEPGMHIQELVERLTTQDSETKAVKGKRKAVASAGVEMLLKMVFEDNFVHGDLHPGNLLVRETEDSNHHLVILDPGIVASLSQKDLKNFRAVFRAVVMGDGSQVGKLFLQHSEHHCVDRAAFIEEMSRLVLAARGEQLRLAKIDVSALLTDVFGVLHRHRVKLEANYASVILAIMVLEGLGRTLDPDLDLIMRATPYLLF